MVEWTDKRVSIAILSSSNRSLGFEHRVDTTDCIVNHMLAWQALYVVPSIGQERAQRQK